MLNSGGTACGKYENHRPAIKPLDLSVSNPGKNDPNLQNQVPAADFVVEMLGNARTLFNPNTRFRSS